MHSLLLSSEIQPDDTGIEQDGENKDAPDRDSARRNARDIGGDPNVADDATGDATGDAVGEVPEFLLQLEAGWVLASAVWEGVALLERDRDYERAVELLAQLLATR